MVEFSAFFGAINTLNKKALEFSKAFLLFILKHIYIYIFHKVGFVCFPN